MCLPFHKNNIKNLIQVGLIYRGPFDARPDDTFGLGASKLQLSDRYTRNVKYPGGLTQTRGAVVGGVQFIADF